MTDKLGTINSLMSDINQFKTLLDQTNNLGQDNVRVKIGNDHQLTVDNRSHHFFNVGSFRTSNEERKQDIINTAQYLKNMVVSRVGNRVGNRLFAKYISARQESGNKAIRLFDVKQLMNKVDDYQLTKAFESIRQVVRARVEARKPDYDAVFSKLNISKPLLVHALSRGRQETTSSIGHNAEDLAARLSDLNRTLAATESLINKFATGVEFNSEVQDRIRDDLQAVLEEQKTTLQQRIADVTKQVQTYPLSGHEMHEAMDDLLKTGKDLMAKLQQPGATAHVARIPDARQLSTLAHTLTDLHRELSRTIQPGIGNTPATATVITQFRLRMIDEIARAFQLGKTELTNLFKDQFQNTLEHKDWSREDRTFLVGLNKQPVTVTDIHAPANESPTFGHIYRELGVNGLSSDDQTRHHAVNLWQTGIKKGDTELYSGIRHSLLCAYRISDHEERVAANASRAKDIFIKAFEQLPHQADLLRQVRENPHKVVNLPLTSVSLFTPDYFRTGLNLDVSKAEKRFLEEQLAAWRNACDADGICEVTVYDGDEPVQVKLKPSVISFNYAVNQGGQNPLMQKVFSGWSISEPLNERSLHTLIGDPRSSELGGVVGDFYNQCQDPVVKRKINILVRQIRELHLSGGYRKPGEDPFRLPARINLLTYLCGMTPCFNCKSGKDRTGQMDVATKELALSLDAKMEDLSLSPNGDVERLNLIRDLGINSGNHRLQKLSCGVPGFKLKGLSGVEKLYGSATTENFLGLGTAM